MSGGLLMSCAPTVAPRIRRRRRSTRGIHALHSMKSLPEYNSTQAGRVVGSAGPRYHAAHGTSERRAFGRRAGGPAGSRSWGRAWLRRAFVAIRRGVVAWRHHGAWHRATRLEPGWRRVRPSISRVRGRSPDRPRCRVVRPVVAPGSLQLAAPAPHRRRPHYLCDQRLGRGPGECAVGPHHGSKGLGQGRGQRRIVPRRIGPTRLASPRNDGDHGRRAGVRG